MSAPLAVSVVVSPQRTPVRAPETFLQCQPEVLRRLRARCLGCLADRPIDQRCPVRGADAAAILAEVEAALVALAGRGAA